MAIIWPCPFGVEEYASAGRAIEVPRLTCRDCRAALIFWAGYARFVRAGAKTRRIWVRRGRCVRCSRTHALLPNFLLVRRLDVVTVIGVALGRAVSGTGQRTIAEQLGLAHTTVREWRRRHRARAPTLVAGFTAAAVALAGTAVVLDGDHERASMQALAATWRHADQRFGRRVGDAWQLASTVTGGNWLGTNTTPLWANVDAAGFMPPRPHKEG